jgi:hypothetical protein
MEKVASRLRQLGTDLQQIAPEAAVGLDDLARDLQKAADCLSQEVSPGGPPASPTSNGKVPIVRYGTVCGRYRQGSTARRADLRVGGLWLKGAGFGIGQRYEIRVERRGKLTVRAIERQPQRGRKRVARGSRA